MSLSNDVSTPLDDPKGSSQRKNNIRKHADRFAAERLKWKKRTGYFHTLDEKYMRFLIPEGRRVLDLGCGIGDMLAALKPSHGVGVDFSAEMIGVARASHPDLTFIEADIESDVLATQLDGQTFDFIILSDTIGMLEDCQRAFEALHRHCHDDTRIIVAYYSGVHDPILRFAEKIGMKMPQVVQNSISRSDIRHLLFLSDFDMVKQERRILSPIRLFGLGSLINRYLSALPGLRALNIRNYTVARSLQAAKKDPLSVSVIIPCRNEKGNVEPALQRLPQFGRDLEVVFIEGHSQDGTYEEIKRVAEVYKDKFKIVHAQQDGKGKGDAMRKGYDLATGEVLMILDGDLTVPPEDMPKFYDALVSGKGNFINGSRLVYPMEDEAMRFLNLIANNAFAWIFSWLLNQRITDTLCGTKVLTRKHYDRIAEGRSYFGDFDPFGDFDLIFGASKENLKIVDLPIRYAARRYGETQISRFTHGWLLLRMVLFAYRKLAAF